MRWRELRTLWFDTGSRCNLACESSFIESSPSNDSLACPLANEVAGLVDEATPLSPGLREIGSTRGGPLTSPELAPMLGDRLERGLELPVLTNATRPMMKRQLAEVV